MSSWEIELEGVRLSGDCNDDTASGMLSFPPEGLGLPGLRTEDTTYAQRDGVRHFNDWYEPRIITLTDVTVCPDEFCNINCAHVRAKVRDIIGAWSRKCDDVEMVIRTGCEVDVETRTNLALTPRPNPSWQSFPNPADHWDVQGGTGAYVAAVVPGEPDLTTATRLTASGAGAAVFQFDVPLPSAGPVSGSLWIRSSMDVIVQAVADGTTPIFAAPATTYPTWTRIEGVASGVATVNVAVVSNAAGWVEVTGLILERSGVVGDYFDGASSNDPEHFHSWTGIPFSSTSTEGVDRTLVGPFGMIGRPRAAVVIWERNQSGCATLQLRFDGRDHRLYVLDPDGTPGSGVRCVTLTPAVEAVCRSFPICFPMCFDTDTGDPGSGPVEVDVRGTLCVGVEITLHGQLTNPTIENLTTGDTITYNDLIRASDPPVIIDTDTGTASQGGETRTNLLTGNVRMQFQPGQNVLRLTSVGADDDGYAEACFRDQVVIA